VSLVPFRSPKLALSYTISSAKPASFLSPQRVPTRGVHPSLPSFLFSCSPLSNMIHRRCFAQNYSVLRLASFYKLPPLSTRSKDISKTETLLRTSLPRTTLVIGSGYCPRLISVAADMGNKELTTVTGPSVDIQTTTEPPTSSTIPLCEVQLSSPPSEISSQYRSDDIYDPNRQERRRSLSLDASSCHDIIIGSLNTDLHTTLPSVVSLWRGN
jgi:hypothetical protein